MIITSVKVHKLVTGPGYNNQAVSAEAAVAEGEDPVVIHDKLVGWIDARLNNLKAADDLRYQMERLHGDVKRLQHEKERLAEDVARGNAVVKAHDQLAALAAEKGIRYDSELGDLLLF